MNDDLRSLIDRCLAGEQEAMIELVERFRGPVFGLCLRMLGHRHDAEDAAQETFVRALRSLANWDSARAFQPWLMAIAGNRCRTALAARRRRPMLEPLVEPPGVDEGSLQAARNLAEEVQLALGRLRADYREAFLLFHEHEMSYAEIAEAMQCPLGTVKTWVHRARRELIEYLQLRDVVQEPRHAMRRV